MFRNSRISLPLTALATLLALSVGGCASPERKTMEQILQDFADAMAEIIPDQKANGEAVRKLTDRQPEPFYLPAGGAVYFIDLEDLKLHIGITGNDYEETEETSRFRRNDPEGGIGVSFTVYADDGTRIYSNANLDRADLDAKQSAPFISYTGTGSEFDEPIRHLKMSVVEPGEAILGLEYATFGSWSEVRGDQLRGGFFFSGVSTKSAGMPTTGSATYAGLTIGTMFEEHTKSKYALEGDMALAVNFADGSVDGDFTGMMKTADDGTATPWRDFSMTASINAGTDNFSGTTITSDLMLEGQAEGAFFGPSAAEVAGAWTLSGGGEIALGSFGGGKN